MKPLRNNVLLKIQERDLENDVFTTGTKQKYFIAEAIGDEVMDVQVGDEVYVKPEARGSDVVSEDDILAIKRGNDENIKS